VVYCATHAGEGAGGNVEDHPQRALAHAVNLRAVRDTGTPWFERIAGPGLLLVRQFTQAGETKAHRQRMA